MSHIAEQRSAEIERARCRFRNADPKIDLFVVEGWCGERILVRGWLRITEDV